MFKKLNLKFNLAASPFENLRYRDKTVLVLVRDNKGKYLLATKGFYPDNTCRLLGGGVDADEEILDAAKRELMEETGIEMQSDRFVPLLEVFIEGSHNGDTHTLTVFIYFVQLETEEAVAGDDVKTIAKLSELEYKDNTLKLLELPAGYLYSHPNGEQFSWGDYGKVYGFIQEKSLEEVIERKL